VREKGSTVRIDHGCIPEDLLSHPHAVGQALRANHQFNLALTDTELCRHLGFGQKFNLHRGTSKMVFKV